MAASTVRGRFVWHELMTPDASGAHAFYAKALGWSTETWEQDSAYSMFAASTGPLAGTVAQASGAAHWMPFIGTPDIAASVGAATQRGAAVKKPPTEIANGSRYAVLADPQGAAFALYQPASDLGAEKTAEPGEFSWHELATSDHHGAFDFYAALCGWEKMSEYDMGPPLGTYLIFGHNGRQLGGMFNKGNLGAPGNYWVGYVRVTDVDEIVKNAKSARGSLVNGPMEVPGGDWIAQFFDPQGALFAVHALAADVKASAKAAPPPTAAASAKAPAKAAAKKKAKKAPAKKPAKKKAGGRSGAKRAARKAPTGSKRVRGKKGGRTKTAKRKKTATKKAARTKKTKRPAGKKRKSTRAR
jgi:predicted enzyme related to lactoylglutathione lyase